MEEVILNRNFKTDLQKIIIVSIIFLLNVNISFAYEAGSKSMTFLNIAPNARAAGMGESFTAAVDDLSAVFWNPAGLSFIDNIEAGLNYNIYFGDTTYSSLQIAKNFEFGSFGLNLSIFSYGSIDKYVNGIFEGSLNPYDLLLSLSYGMELFKNFYAGATLKYIYEKLTDQYSGYGIGGDIGIIYIDPLGSIFKSSFLKPLQFGAIVQNFGMGPEYIGESNSLPINIKLGLAYKYGFPSADVKWGGINFMLDLIFPSDASMGIRFGTETWLYDLFKGLDMALRLGLRSFQETDFISGLTAGVGLRISRIEVDYALVNFGDLGMTHRIGLIYKM